MHRYKILNLILGPSAIVFAVVLSQNPLEDSPAAIDREIVSVEPAGRITASSLRGLRSPQEICQQHDWSCSDSSELFLHAIDQSNYPAYRLRVTDPKTSRDRILIVDASSGLILREIESSAF